MFKSKKSKNFGQLNFLAAFDTTPLDKNILLNDDPRVPEFIDRWLTTKFFALDIETMGASCFADALNPFKGKIRLIQIGLDGDEVLVMDMTKPLPDRFLDALEFTLGNTNHHPVGQNIIFDLSFIKQQLGFICRQPRDTRILSILLWCGIKYGNGKKFAHSLAAIANRLFGLEVDKTQQASDWSQPELSNSQLNYAADDVRITYRCFIELCKRLRQWDAVLDITGKLCKYKLTDIAKVECDVIPSFVDLYLTGQPIDVEYGEEVRQQYVDALADLYQPVLAKTGPPYSAQSSKLWSAIKEHYGIALVDDKGGNSTSSAVLFNYYCETKEEALLRISLARSLKKSIDSIDALLDSARENNGYAKGGYNPLGDTGSGRSTCSGMKRSSLTATNLQNLAGDIEHPLILAYNLPSVRSIIRPHREGCMFLQDLSASHLRLAASNSGDSGLVDILSLKDPHALVTSKMFAVAGRDDVDINYCVENKKTDPDVKYYRAIAKTATYTQFNDGKAWTFKNALNKAYVDVSLDDCQKAQDALAEAFPGYTAYANLLGWKAKNSIVDTEYGRFARFRTHDGRLFHVEARQGVNKQGQEYEYVKKGEVTSCNLISPEALVMKKSLTQITEFLRDHPEIDGRLNSFTHDDVSGEDYSEDKQLAKFVYQTIATNFTEALEVDSGLDPWDLESYKSILINNYSEK